MIMPLKKQDFKRAATNKGYIEIRRGDHIIYRFTDREGRIYDQIHTKVSHGGGGDISEDLLSKMYKQMKFSTKVDFSEYIACHISEDEYREMLRTKGYQV